jgi:hypothetical protein
LKSSSKVSFEKAYGGHSFGKYCKGLMKEEWLQEQHQSKIRNKQIERTNKIEREREREQTKTIN